VSYERSPPYFDLFGAKDDADFPAELAARRGRPSRRAIEPARRDRIVELRTNIYHDFNDLHFTEKLNEVEGIAVGRETVRALLRAHGIPPKQARRRPRHRSRRQPWPAEGAPLQAGDGRAVFIFK